MCKRIRIPDTIYGTHELFINCLGREHLFTLLIVSMPDVKLTQNRKKLSARLPCSFHAMM